MSEEGRQPGAGYPARLQEALDLGEEIRALPVQLSRQDILDYGQAASQLSHEIETLEAHKAAVSRDVAAKLKPRVIRLRELLDAVRTKSVDQDIECRSSQSLLPSSYPGDIKLPRTLSDAEHENRLLYGLMEEMAKVCRREHNNCEERYFACPKSDGGSEHPAASKDVCNCAADSINAQIDAFLSRRPVPR